MTLMRHMTIIYRPRSMRMRMLVVAPAGAVSHS
jgi:hypothetical protein